MNKIYFYYEDEPNGYFSNFYKSHFTLQGKEWTTIEHYYQAHKTEDPVYREKIRLASTPDEAKELGNLDECPVRDDWDSSKVRVMKEAIIAKYTQIPKMKERLLNTGDSILFENSQNDYFWGIGRDGSGKSMLGKVLMEVRDGIRSGKYE